MSNETPEQSLADNSVVVEQDYGSFNVDHDAHPDVRPTKSQLNEAVDHFESPPPPQKPDERTLLQKHGGKLASAAAMVASVGVIAKGAPEQIRSQKETNGNTPELVAKDSVMRPAESMASQHRNDMPEPVAPSAEVAQGLHNDVRPPDEGTLTEGVEQSIPSSDATTDYPSPVDNPTKEESDLSNEGTISPAEGRRIRQEADEIASGGARKPDDTTETGGSDLP